MASVFQTMFVPSDLSPLLPNNSNDLPLFESFEPHASCTHSMHVDKMDVDQEEQHCPTSPWSSATDFFSLKLSTMLGWGESSFDIEQGRVGPPLPDRESWSYMESLRGAPGPHSNPFPIPLPPPPSLQNTMRASDSLLTNSNARSKGPFKPQKASRGTSSWQLRQFAEATLGSGSLRKAVKLPEGEDLNEWLAVNVVDFYNQINLLYGSITEFCSPKTCPEMKATDEYEYLWQDSENFKKPTKMPAPEYIEHLMAWCQSNIDNEQLFPSRIGIQFPKSFPTLVRQMFKRLYRVYAHIYCHHYPVIVQLGLEPHLNTSFKHYVLFIDEHGLASGRDFWGPLGELVENMLRSD